MTDTQPPATDALDGLGETDLKYIEEFMRQLYNAEIDRKDKILASMTAISAPIPVLFAALAFLSNSISSPVQMDIRDMTDIIVLAFALSIFLLTVFLALALLQFRQLLINENYTYLPDASSIMATISNLRRFGENHQMVDDGKLANFARVGLIKLYIESATNNTRANDLRLGHRQGVFRWVVAALFCAAVGCVAVAVHRQYPHVWSIMYGRSPGDDRTAAVQHGQRPSNSQASPTSAASADAASQSDERGRTDRETEVGNQ